MPADGVVVAVDVPASVERTWAAVTDWERQGDWMLLTRVRATPPGGRGPGTTLEAWTGVGALAIHDRMVVEVWEPPRRCALRHTGWVVHGPAEFELAPTGPGRCRLVWSEHLDIPFGRAGLLAWRVAGRPALRWGMRRSLRTLAGSLSHAAGPP